MTTPTAPQAPSATEPDIDAALVSTAKALEHISAALARKAEIEAMLMSAGLLQGLQANAQESHDPDAEK